MESSEGFARQPCHPLRTWRDVLVHTEEVLGIVGSLDLLQSTIVRSIGRYYRFVLCIIIKVVDVSAGSHEWLQGSVGIARPFNTCFVLCGVHPFRQHQQVVAWR